MLYSRVVDVGRVAYLCLSLIAASVVLSIGAGTGALAQGGATAQPLKIGIVGSGKLGGAVGTQWVKAGHEVFFSSRHPEQLQPLVSSLGPRAKAGTVQEAIAFGDVILIAVPYSALPQLGQDNAAALSGKIVLDACNPIAARDGEIAKEAMTNGIGATSKKYLPGTRLVRAFNPVGHNNFGVERTGDEKLGMPVAGDDPEAVKVASQLVVDSGLEPIVVPLDRAMEFAPGTPLFGKPVPAAELRKRLGVAQ